MRFGFMMCCWKSERKMSLKIWCELERIILRNMSYIFDVYELMEMDGKFVE